MRIVLLSIIMLFSFITCAVAEQVGTASWYSVESCKREGTSGICANGEVFKDEELTCASWDYQFGTSLKVISVDTEKSVCVKVTDRGPNKRLYESGRIIDLSKRAFSEIADLKQGIIQVKVEVLNAR